MTGDDKRVDPMVNLESVASVENVLMSGQIAPAHPSSERAALENASMLRKRTVFSALAGAGGPPAVEGRCMTATSSETGTQTPTQRLPWAAIPRRASASPSAARRSCADPVAPCYSTRRGHRLYRARRQSLVAGLSDHNGHGGEGI
jgi:hypothetical protein